MRKSIVLAAGLLTAGMWASRNADDGHVQGYVERGLRSAAGDE